MSLRILVISASSDIARAVCHEYASRGYKLILTSRNPETLQDFQKDLEIRYQVEVEVLSLDVEDFGSFDGFLSKMPEDLYGVICSAGYLGDQQTAQGDQAEALKLIQTNFTGCTLILDRLAGLLEEKKRGFLVGISSVAGDRGRAKNYFYGAAKAGFTAFLSGLRSRMFDSGVHVLTVKPGFVATKMVEGLQLNPRLTARPEQVAKDIIRAQESGKDIIYTLWFWYFIMQIICLIPEKIFKRMNI